MSISTIKQGILQNVYNIPGWKTKKHIVVIESDDWGSVRMPSKEVYDSLLKRGIRVDKCHYCSNDTLASEADLQALYEVLLSVTGIDGRPAVVTANTVVANPDFDKIKKSDFKEYYYETIDNTFARFAGCEQNLNLWKKGEDTMCFRLQSHGREHLNVARWMHYLQNNYSETRFAFDLGVYGLSTNITSEKRRSFLPAFDFESKEEELQVNDIAVDGLRIFEELFGFKSESFIAPNYIWGASLEEALAGVGVKYIQGQHAGIYRTYGDVKSKKRIRYQGKRNGYDQIDLVRNAFFEPAENPNKDCVNCCLAEIKNAFYWHHPAIICSHRVNFVSGINSANRDRNLRLLDILLKEIVNHWPDVVFMSSDQLGRTVRAKF